MTEYRNPYKDMDPDQLLHQAQQCIEVMGMDCTFHTKYREFCDLFIAMTVMANTVVNIARKNFRDETWAPPHACLEVIEGGKD